MEVLILLIFVSLVLVTGAIGFFAWGLRNRAYDHADRLTLLPLEDDSPTRIGGSASLGIESDYTAAAAAVGRSSCAPGTLPGRSSKV